MSHVSNKKLLARAKLLTQIRAFFATRGVLEVETPLLGFSTIPDPHIHSFKVKDRYLQTSPEFAMKRLLASGSGDIYQICKAFRDEEQGRLHSPEFTILEWYRIGFTHHQLMDEMAAFLQYLLPVEPAARISYATLCIEYLGVNPHQCDVTQLQEIARQRHLEVVGIAEYDFDAWLEVLFTSFVEPHLGQERPAFVYDFPASQAALARIRQDGAVAVAERFEVYLQGIELANGFHELTDPLVQRQRFIADNKKRQLLGLPTVAMDEAFLMALARMPQCSGVALGVDRLLLIMQQLSDLQQVINF